MEMIDTSGVAPQDKSLVILQSLLCLLREKNLLTRADIEELSDKVQARAQAQADAMGCCREAALAAAQEMSGIDRYLGTRYGGKHRRHV